MTDVATMREDAWIGRLPAARGRKIEELGTMGHADIEALSDACLQQIDHHNCGSTQGCQAPAEPATLCPARPTHLRPARRWPNGTRTGGAGHVFLVRWRLRVLGRHCR